MSVIKIITYTTRTNKVPFTSWLDDLDAKAQTIILARLNRVSLGNFGDCKPLKNGTGVWEFRIDHGPGYRIYFGKDGTKIVILLIGGEKKSQTRDITKAKHYWLEYRESSHE